jgi:hypothetical protein
VLQIYSTEEGKETLDCNDPTERGDRVNTVIHFGFHESERGRGDTVTD